MKALQYRLLYINDKNITVQTPVHYTVLGPYSTAYSTASLQEKEK